MKRSALAVLAGFAVSFAFAAEAPAAKPKGDPAKAKAKVEQICAACHGVDGNSAASANPSLAGQHPEYLEAQLVAFKKGTRKSAIMQPQAATLSDEDIRNLSAYFAEQKPKERAGTNKALMETGKKLYRGGVQARGIPACMACHGPSGSGIPAQYPRLGGQHAAYTVAQLNAFKLGKERANLPMQQIAQKLSDDEMKAVAEYIAGLR
ncbi:c-type cytochrome [Chitinimonas lacunae]|uniref:C-type cytochrome n=1 Tax=Chitinimonas lacunae TaxID=1963018 RepID=A0ABV8MQH9_9NEIS